MILLIGIGSVVALVIGWLAFVWDELTDAVRAFTRSPVGRR